MSLSAYPFSQGHPRRATEISTPCSASVESIDDEAVLYQANLNRALLITENKDFGELVFRQGLVHMGVVLVRLAGLSPRAKAASVSTVLANHEAELLEVFSVISPGRVRIRGGS